VAKMLNSYFLSAHVISEWRGLLIIHPISDLVTRWPSHANTLLTYRLASH